MSNANKSQPEGKLDDGIEVPNEDDFSLAALDFLSADLAPSSSDTQANDFFDTGALTSLASLDWRDVDDIESDAVAKESAEELEVDKTPASPLSDELLDIAESMTSPLSVEDAEEAMSDASLQSSVPDDDLLTLAEQSAPVDAPLLDLAESAAEEVVDDDSSFNFDDETSTIILSPSAEITTLQAAMSTSQKSDEADATELNIEEPLDLLADVTELEPEDSLLVIAEAATEFETDVEPVEAELTDEAEDELLAIAEAATEPERDESPFILDDALLALADDSAEIDTLLASEDPLFSDLVDLSADEALDVLFDESSPTDAELDALLDDDSRYLDQIVAGLDAEFAQFEAEEAEAIELLTSRQDAREGEQYVVFILDDTLYGIPVANVLEVGEPPAVTYVPFVPYWVRGIINLRGEIVSLVDLRGFLHGVNSDEKGWMIISQTRDESVTVGLLVDDVRGNRQFSSQQQAKIAAGLDEDSSRFLQTVFEENGQMIAVLDFDRLLNSAEMRQFEAM